MEKKFDLEKIGKRMPYTVPSDTFKEIEENVIGQLNRRKRHQQKVRRSVWYCGAFAAACIGLLIVLKPTTESSAPSPSSPRLTTSEDMLSEIDYAYANLSEEDFEILTENYNDDIFLNLILSNNEEVF